MSVTVRVGTLRSALFGGAAQEVIRHATCPVLALHEVYEKAEEEPVPKISFASHMFENFEMKALLR